MKKLAVLLLTTALVFAWAGFAAANGNYYEFSSFHAGNTDFRGGSDCASYNDKIYVRNGNRRVDVYTVSINDISKKDQTPFLAGVDNIYGTSDDIANPDYQTRALKYETYITLAGDESINVINQAEMYIDSEYLYIAGGSTYNDILKFNKNDGAYIGKAVDANAILPSTWKTASMLGYDSANNTWYAANEDRKVYSSTGGNWTYEFTFNNMGGSHGDGMEFVNGSLFVSDMTSNHIAQWVKKDGIWVEKEVFDYEEVMGGSAKDVEGMGFGVLGHFWVTSAYWSGGSGNSYLYELGGGDLGAATTTPEPSTLALLFLGFLGLAGYGKKKRMF